jgi:vancomycin permeability regulator SanA
MSSLFNSLQTNLQIDVIRHNLKKIRENEQLKNRKRDLLLRLKHLAELEITKENVNE